MCTVSMIIDHYHHRWGRHLQPNPTIPNVTIPAVNPSPKVPAISAEEIEEFRELLERARAYDREHNQPDCGLEEKRQKIKDLAEELGVEIEFV